MLPLLLFGRQNVQIHQTIRPAINGDRFLLTSAHAISDHCLIATASLEGQFGPIWGSEHLVILRSDCGGSDLDIGDLQ